MTAAKAPPPASSDVELHAVMLECMRRLRRRSASRLSVLLQKRHKARVRDAEAASSETETGRSFDTDESLQR
ncbi:hypothetical protein FQA47_018336 [Oryzias melastigma]|uniref:Uncharacterized protein n=1 Tax=Oryzias melastigma TaxID=30732 RepID=A0A834FT39_ORYME|nr:hypothetical protein FQA47_018336 [Oryzias melastigma]